MNNLLQHSKLFLKRNASTILTCIGGSGVVATFVMAVKATPKAISLIDKAKNEKGEDLTKFEIVRTAAPVYIPSILVGASTIACIFGANVLNKRKQAALMSAYALLDSSYKDFKNKVNDLYGEEGTNRIKEELAKDKYEETDIKVEDDTMLFYDEFSKRYFESTMYKVQYAEYAVNRDIHMRGYASLGEFYEYLDIENIEGGEELGWSEGGNFSRYWQSWMDFSHHTVVMDDGLECKIITMFMEPYPGYEDL